MSFHNQTKISGRGELVQGTVYFHGIITMKSFALLMHANLKIKFQNFQKVVILCIRTKNRLGALAVSLLTFFK
jgi:hypothetical protein